MKDELSHQPVEAVRVHRMEELMQINRLFEMVYILLERRIVTAKEFAERFEVSVRTIYRDVDILSQSGIPIYSMKGRGGGICLMEKFILNKSALSLQERNEILWALQGVNAVKAADTKATLAKLSSLFGESDNSWIEVDFSGWTDGANADLELVKKAVVQNRVLEFDYYNTYGEKTNRQTEPLQLWFKDKAWYLKAFCRRSQGLRLFKITRIKNITLSEERFQRSLLSEESKEMDGRIRPQMVEIKLRVEGSQAFRIYDEYKEDMIEKQEDGTFITTLICPEDEWVYSYILSYGPMAQVLEPERIVEIIKNRIKGMTKLYM